MVINSVSNIVKVLEDGRFELVCKSSVFEVV